MVEAVLVLGGAGYVGSHACKAIAASGRLPIVIDSLVAGHANSVQWGPLVECDLRDTPRLSHVMAQSGASSVMHFAASIEVGIGEREPLAFYDNNVCGTVSVLKAMAHANINRIVFSSTCAVYGDAPPPLTEELPRNPASVYGRTKSMVESILEDCAKATDLRVAILRYFNASGADPSGLIGEQHDPETHLIPNALKAAAGLGGALNVFGTDYPTPDGTCQRDYVHVNDLADAHVAALSLLQNATGVHRYNLGTGRPYSVLEVIGAIERVTGKAPPYISGPRRPGDVPVLTADLGRARTDLGFDPKMSDIETIVSTAWNFHKHAWKLV